MTLTRIYLPLSAADVRALADGKAIGQGRRGGRGAARAGGHGASHHASASHAAKQASGHPGSAPHGPPLVAYAVTDAVRAAYPDAGEEDWEYAALCEAADAAAALRDTPGARRVVAAADVDESWVSGPAAADGTGSAVLIAEPVPLRRIASFHVDEAGGTDEDELLWYDATELAAIVDLL